MTGMYPYPPVRPQAAIAAVPNPNTHVPGGTVLRAVAYVLWTVGFACASPLAWRLVIQLSGHSDLLKEELKQPGPKPPFLVLAVIGLIIWFVVAILAIMNLIRDAMHPARPVRPYLTARIIMHTLMVVVSGVIAVTDGIIIMIVGLVVLWIGFLLGM